MSSVQNNLSAALQIQPASPHSMREISFNERIGILALSILAVISTATAVLNHPVAIAARVVVGAPTLFVAAAVCIVVIAYILLKQAPRAAPPLVSPTVSPPVEFYTDRINAEARQQIQIDLAAYTVRINAEARQQIQNSLAAENDIKAQLKVLLDFFYSIRHDPTTSRDYGMINLAEALRGYYKTLNLDANVTCVEAQYGGSFYDSSIRQVFNSAVRQSSSVEHWINYDKKSTDPALPKYAAFCEETVIFLEKNNLATKL